MDAVNIKGINLLLFFLLLHLRNCHTALCDTLFFLASKIEVNHIVVVRNWWNHKLIALQRTKNCTDAVADLTGCSENQTKIRRMETVFFSNYYFFSPSSSPSSRP